MLVSLKDARLLRSEEMEKDMKNSTGELMAHNTPMPYDTNGQVIYMPVTSIVGAPVDDPARWFLSAGNRPCRPDGMGNNNSKFVNGLKVATGWLFDKSGVAINSTVIDFSTASYDDDNRQTTNPPPEAVCAQAQTAIWHFEHLKLEGVKAGDDLVIVSGGAWTAEGGPLRPGLLALWQHLVDYGVHAIIADDLTYPSQVNAGLAFTLGLELVLVKGFDVYVDVAALADTERAEKAAREHAAAMSSAGGKATLASHGPQMANGGKEGGKATVASHGPQMSNGGKAVGKALGTASRKTPYQTNRQYKAMMHMREIRAKK